MTHLRIIFLISILIGLSACSPSSQSTATPTILPPTITSTPAPTVTATPVPTATPLTCLKQAGHVKPGAVQTTKPAQEFLIYLPPCYEFKTDQRYPVLYLLHGQTYTDDQWVRLGAPAAADKLILSGKTAPFIIVFPDDRYWNVDAGPGFGDRLINMLIPYIDKTYRTMADRNHRALGGLSRGGGWTAELGLTRYDLFGTLGFHSPAIFVEDGSYITKWMAAIPSDQWPRIWIDAGDHDSELGITMQFESLLSNHNIPHEWHMFTGDHSESYWKAHVAEYIQWYADGWTNNP